MPSSYGTPRPLLFSLSSPFPSLNLVVAIWARATSAWMSGRRSSRSVVGRQAWAGARREGTPACIGDGAGGAGMDVWMGARAQTKCPGAIGYKPTSVPSSSTRPVQNKPLPNAHSHAIFMSDLVRCLVSFSSLF
jgi:hypothetical protein